MLVQGYLQYPPNLQVYNESRLGQVEGVMELFITQSGRGEFLCNVISSTHPMCRCIMRAGWTWLRGGRELIIRWAEPVDRGEYLCKVLSSTRPMCRCIMRAGQTWLRG